MAFTKVELFLHVRIRMRVIFMGTPSYATTILKALVQDSSIKVPLLITQEDKPVGRKQTLTPPDTKAWVMQEGLGIEVYQPKSLRTEEAYAKIISYQPDVIVVAAYGKLLPKSILEIAPCINLHASLLPKYRGASPIQSTLLEGEAYAGVTSMLMEEGLDTGAMLGFSYHCIGEVETSKELFDILAHHAARLTLVTLEHFNSLSPIKQQEMHATHCKKIKKEDGEVSFENDARYLMQKFRALTPWPGVFLDSGLKLIEISIVDENTLHDETGLITSISKEGIVVTCKRGSLVLKQVQPSSKNAMKASDYIRGKRLECGDRLA
jgi:methionyl-tRNA formyltransferase